VLLLSYPFALHPFGLCSACIAPMPSCCCASGIDASRALIVLLLSFNFNLLGQLRRGSLDPIIGMLNDIFGDIFDTWCGLISLGFIALVVLSALYVLGSCPLRAASSGYCHIGRPPRSVHSLSKTPDRFIYSFSTLFLQVPVLAARVFRPLRVLFLGVSPPRSDFNLI
jgi:hypothetical protein